MNERSDLNRRSFMKKTALTASAITLLASGVGLGNEGSATASASVSATASVSASATLCRNNSGSTMGGTCDWNTSKEEHRITVFASQPQPNERHVIVHPCKKTGCTEGYYLRTEWENSDD